jgi:hypothetical protein
MRKPEVEMLSKLLYWYDGRSRSFRERANPALWDSAREVLRNDLKREGERKAKSEKTT